MELDPLSLLFSTKGLIWIGRRSCKKDRTIGQVKRFPIPLKGEKLMRKPRKDGIIMGCIRQIHWHDSDFRLRPCRALKGIVLDEGLPQGMKLTVLG
jgi:hypothetical protein